MATKEELQQQIVELSLEINRLKGLNNKKEQLIHSMGRYVLTLQQNLMPILQTLGEVHKDYISFAVAIKESENKPPAET